MAGPFCAGLEPNTDRWQRVSRSGANMRKIGAVAAALVAMGGTGIATGGGIAAASNTPAPAVAKPDSTNLSRYVVAPEFCNLRSSALCGITLASRFNMAEGPSLWATNMRWYRWGDAKATGTGILWASDDTKWRAGRVTIVLSRPERYVTINGHRHPYFTRAHIIGGRGVAHYWRWLWTGNRSGTWEGSP